MAVAAAPRHYVLRTSWVIGEGNNFVRTMQRLAANGVSPSVVDDQVGRLTFTGELARATRHLRRRRRAVRHLQRQQRRHADLLGGRRRGVFALAAGPPTTSRPVTTEDYSEGKDGLAPRPLRSVLDLSKIEATGFVPEDAMDALERYVAG